MIIALTSVRFALHPECWPDGHMRVARELLPTVDAKKAVKRNSRAQIKTTTKPQEEMSAVYKEFGNRWLFSSAGANAGTFLPCLPPCAVHRLRKLHRQPNFFLLHKLEQIQPQASAISPKHLYQRWGSCSLYRHCSRRQPLNGGRKNKIRISNRRGLLPKRW